MPEPQPEAPHSAVNLVSIFYALFKRKRLILSCALGGLIAAAAVFFLYPPVYESNAKLLVRYVVERSGVDPEVPSGPKGSGLTTDGVIASEVEILTSWDLAVQVVEALGVKRVLPEGGSAATVTAAAATITSGLEVVTHKGSNILFVSYKNRNPEVATSVLNELVNRYFTKHLEVHRSAGAFDFVTQQTDQVRGKLTQTEDALKTLRGKAGIISLGDSIAALNTEEAKTGEQLRTAEGDLAEQRARVKLMEGSGGAASSTAQASPATNPTAQPTNGEIQEYQALVMRLEKLRQTQLDLLSKYTPANSEVKLTESQIDDLESQRRNLDKKFPELAYLASKVSPQGRQSDLRSERASLAGLEAKTETLRKLLGNVQERKKQLSDAGPQIASLEREKELEETNYKYFQGSVEKARIDEALDPSKMPNISAVQRPSPPSLVTKLRDKIALGLAGGGLALGLVLALGIELYLNRNVKRPLELEGQLHTPLFLSIPYSGSNGRLRLRNKKPAQNAEHAQHTGQANIAPWDADHFIRPYSAAIRDRLGLYFELNRMTHKPKLIGVTGFSEGAGTSTLAAGLAAAFSGTGDGKVLLVDANAADGAVHPFFAGKPASSLTAALEPAAPIASAADNLYLATVAPISANAGPAQLALKRFFALMPNLKASDFDYIIFDMPPLTQISPTLGWCGFMDKVLLVVEAEENNREVVKRGYRDLMSARANVSVVLNKVRSYVPKWLDTES